MSQRRAKRSRRDARLQAPAAPTRRDLKRPAIAVAVVAVLVVAVIGGLVARGHSSPAAPVAVSSGAAPQLTGTDPVTGRHVSLTSFAGKPVVLNIWASWCPGCNQEAADLRQFAAAHPNAQVVGIDYQDTTGGAQGFYRRWGWSHPSIFDPHGNLAASLGLQGLPTTIFLDARHRIATRIVGATNRDGFESGLRLALAG